MEVAMQELWKKVDCYFSERLAPILADDKLEAALKVNRAAGLPAIDVSRLQGKFLEVLVCICGARRILEIGTLGGYSTIWMARALPEDGRIVSLEVNPLHTEVARANLLNAGVADRVDLCVGQAVKSLSLLASSGGEAFDMIFIDADKQNNAEYLAWALKLSRPGTVIVTDNVVRDGKVVQPGCAEADIEGIRRFTELLAAEPRLSATVVQTVGAKGYDGFALAVVLR
jgi:predicted O-methyltransferase YrrM